MIKTKLLLAAAGAAFFIEPASAVVFTSGTGTITSTDLVQTARVFRDGTPSTWTAPKAFPGTTAQNPTYYDLINATFASNAVQTIYYEITYSTTQTASPVPFSVAYRNSFDPTNLATNYIGDAGSSPVNSSITYQVIVGAGQQLVLNFQAVGGVPVPYSYSVAAFSDANRGEVFLPVTNGVPEPETWAMMVLGFGGVGFAMRRRSKVSARIRFA